MDTAELARERELDKYLDAQSAMDEQDEKQLTIDELRYTLATIRKLLLPVQEQACTQVIELIDGTL